MIREYIFATGNKNKAIEIESALPIGFAVKTLAEAGIDVDITEPFDTLEENSRHKAVTIYNLVRQNCFAEDTGLEVESLNNEPGVRSARYAGEPRNDQKNIEKLLDALKDFENRTARFRTVITLVENGTEYQFEGICNGMINGSPKGTEGFGYDPVFIPEGSTHTFAQMQLAEKNKFSHRKKALSKMIDFLNTSKAYQ
jgi:XTP/dITP diphosphohydrolase